MNNPVIIFQRIRELREKKGLKSKEVAAALSMNYSTYSHYEKGERFPRLDTFYDICRFYDVDPNYLFGLSDVPHPFSRQPSLKEIEAAWKETEEALEQARQALYKISPR